VPAQASPNQTSGAVLPRVILRLATAGLALLVLGATLGLSLVGRHGGGPVQSWDDTVWRWSINHRGPWAGTSKVIDFLGDAGAFGIGCLLLTLLLLRRRRSPRSLVPIVAYLGGEGLVFILRLLIHRHRPPSADYPGTGALPGIHQTSYSFPSGHAVAVTAVLFALLGTLALTHRRSWPWPLALLASLALIQTRLIVGVHWFSDVAIGLPLGIGWGLTVALVATHTPHWPQPRQRADPPLHTDPS